MGWRFWRRVEAHPRDATPSAGRGRSGDENGGRAEPTAVLRIRARRRLIGAAALLLAVAVVLPMVLDKEPRPVPDSIPIDIPSDRTPFSPRLALPPPPEAGTAPVAPLPEAAPAQPGKDAPAPSGDRAESSAKPAEKADATAPAKPSAPPVVKATEHPDEERRARDILEGRATAATAGASANGGRYLLQAAALGSEGAARELAERLKKAGFAPFTERADTRDGVRYRVRLGPYATRDEAERARARLRALGIHASVIAS
ncbi:MAG: SPOR domain-containing protein [Burkholderiaceae bacterium]